MQQRIGHLILPADGMTRLTIQQSFDLAVQHHGAGRLREAEQLYRQVLAQQPQHAGALQYLGMIAFQSGQKDVAVDLLRRALATRPSDPAAHYNLGVVLQGTGQVDEAIAAYQKAVALKPDWPEAQNNLGNTLQAKGRLDEALAAYRKVIALMPNAPEAHNNLGNALKAKGLLDGALAAYHKAIALRPNAPEVHNNLGVTLHAKGQTDEAIAAYRQAITLQSRYPDAYNNLGNALQASGRLDEAIAAYRQAIALKPDYPEAHSGLGNVLKEQGHLDEAIAACRQAIALDPRFAEAHSDLGNALQAKGRLDEAIAAFGQAIAIKPQYAAAYSNLGNALQAKAQLDEAIAAYRQAVAVKPDFAEAFSNLGNALKDKGQLDEAIAACRQAIALKSNHPEAHHNLGNALQAKGCLDEAMAAYRRALELRPSYPEAYSNLGNVLEAKGRVDEAIAAYHQAITCRPDFPEAYNNLGNALKARGDLDEAIAACRRALVLRGDYVEAHSNLVLALHYHPGFNAPAIAQEERRWNQQHAEPLRKCIQPHANDRDPGRRLRIGYVSPDFRDHVVALFLLPLLAHHDHQNVEVFAYAQVPAPDGMTRRLATHTDAWRSLVGLSDSQTADLIRQDRIDILVDLAMHTAGNRLLVFARKPAPVQVTYLAYAGSSGLSTMDYRLSDPYLDPPGADGSIYSEKTIRLPETYWCYQPIVDAPLQAPPAMDKRFITFGCLNNFCKVNEAVLNLWAHVLGTVPNSRLLLHAQEGSHRQRVLDQLRREGIEPHRVSFAGKVPVAGYFELYQSIDIALDTFPYGGGTTTCDALWMGVPVVSLAGQTAVGRAGLSILSNVGLPELVADTPEQYVQIAASLARNLPRLKELRSTLRQRMQGSPVMDAPKFARGVEAACRQMWRKWCATT